MASAAPELMEPSATPGAQTGTPSGGGELSPSLVPPDYEDEFLRYLWRDYLYPKQYEWVLIAAYVAVFLVALVGNTLGRCLGPCGAADLPWGLEGVLGLAPLYPPPRPHLGWVARGVGERGGRDSLVRAGMALPMASPPSHLPTSALPCSLPGRVEEPPHEDGHQLLHRQPVPG